MRRSLHHVHKFQLEPVSGGAIGASAGRIADDIRVALVGRMELKPGPRVLLGGDMEIGLLAADVLGVEVLQEGHAPLTTRARGQALGNERCDRRVFASEIPPDLAEGDVEAEADFVVGVHARIVRAAGRMAKANVARLRRGAGLGCPARP